MAPQAVTSVSVTTDTAFPFHTSSITWIINTLSTSVITPTPSSTPTPSPSTTSTPSSSTTPTSPTSSPPAPTETDRPRGLTISTTVGIGVGVAVICVIIFTVGFVCVRRRRRKFGLTRKEREQREVEGLTPDEEIAKKLEKGEKAEGGVAEIGGGEAKKTNGGAVEAGGNAVPRAELGGDLADAEEKKKQMADDGSVSELPTDTEKHVQELPGQEQAFEMGGDGAFIAELDSKEIERMKSLRATRRPVQDADAPPLPTQDDAAALPSSTQQEASAPTRPPVPDIVINEPEETKM
ncbi:hypothetical protein K458DRAFT_424778 [Lentithecium fluviatile CBS 122367]|uniref:Mid2 domain-containing protein n=1 Tax=Lentithecium fluviatile CBS 122367 TaxID=1168545 RepID=A0A6G1IDI5_9PLEO|nr:hypothetical protein K458DRAFT_424778 [Lentithecium fluviatile CBS 122367]